MRRVLTLFFAVLIITLPKFYQLGRDIANKDAMHFKNWSYIFMKELEVGNYDRLYVTVQPGVLTIYTNIVGFKAMYFVRDHFGLITAEGKNLELVLHTYQKIPKSIVLSALALAIFLLMEKVFNKKQALLFITLFSLEPFVIGHSRVIQADALPMHLAFTASLVLGYGYRFKKYLSFAVVLAGILIGLSIIEKANSIILFVPFSIFIFFMYKDRLSGIKASTIFIAVSIVTMILGFPAFWGNFNFTFYRVFLGSYLQGVVGVDAENFTYRVTPHIKPFTYYPQFLLNKVSEFTWFGVLLAIGIVIYLLLKKCEHVRDFLKNKYLLFMVSTPTLWFLVHQLATKKADRYMIMLFPFLIMAAVYGYLHIFDQIKRGMVWKFIVLVLIVRIFQLAPLFPDFLLYKNSVSPDTKYSASETAWGSGRYKLGQFLEKTYGSDQRVLISDSGTLTLFYPGKIFEMDDYRCGEDFELYVSTGGIANECVERDTVLDSEFSIPGDITYKIYKYAPLK